ncbi:hypothetical protein DL93DRAFT_2232584 [Clavulina sp. PMI_390]|nr:hypothetical protein DL93DRAFT_2232584 [Clavulina sp. PMI_390]
MRFTSASTAVAALAISAFLPYASASPALELNAKYPRATAAPKLQARASISTSYTEVATLLITNGNRVYTTLSVGVPILVGSTSSGTPTGGGNGTVASHTGNSTMTTSGGGNGTAIQSVQTTSSSTPTTLPYAATTIQGGGGAA